MRNLIRKYKELNKEYAGGLPHIIALTIALVFILIFTIWLLFNGGWT